LKLKNTLKELDITSRFLTIGFTEHHRADLLNQIALAGSEVGNFIYVDTSKADFQKQIEDSLISSLELTSTASGLRAKMSSQCMEFNKSMVLEKSIIV
jgi:hypothetical protein